MIQTLGIVGAGKLGMAIARSAVAAGFTALVTSSDVLSTKLIAEVMAPGAQVVSFAEVASRAEVIVLALPLHRLRELEAEAFDGKVLIDAINYWEPVDGPVEKFGVAMGETSSLVQNHFAKALVVKSLNQLGYHDVDEGVRPKGAPDRLGVALAGNDEAAKVVVKQIVDQLGFDPVDAGTLADGVRLGPGGAAFGATFTAAELRAALGLTTS